MSTPLAGKFQDHYAVLGIDPKADSDTIHRAYSALAAKYHPKNTSSGDKEKFAAVTLAYEVLADPAARKTFDSIRTGPEQEGPPRFRGEAFFESVSQEANRRFALLCVLYDRRQQRPFAPSLAMRQLEAMLTPGADELTLTIWFLKQRGLIKSDDKSSLQITVEGMEYLEKNLPAYSSVKPFLKLAEAVAEHKPAAAAPKSAAAAPVVEPPPPPEPVAAPPVSHSITAGWKLNTPHRPSVLTKKS